MQYVFKEKRINSTMVAFYFTVDDTSKFKSFLVLFCIHKYRQESHKLKQKVNTMQTSVELTLEHFLCSIYFLPPCCRTPALHYRMDHACSTGSYNCERVFGAPIRYILRSRLNNSVKLHCPLHDNDFLSSTVDT